MADDVEYVTALEPLYIGTVLAHNAGDPQVPAANVKRNGWDKQVAKPGTKAAEQAQS